MYSAPQTSMYVKEERDVALHESEASQSCGLDRALPKTAPCGESWGQKVVGRYYVSTYCTHM